MRLTVRVADVEILVLVGSLRRDSVNAAMARAALGLAPEGVALTRYGLRDLPLYDGDAELSGPPAEVLRLYDAVAASDGVLLFSPEYNLSFPAVLKNAIDWMSRPPRAWTGKAFSIVTATPGARAGLSVRTHFEAIMSRMPVRLFDTLGIGTYGEKMGDDGELADAATISDLAAHVAAFAAFAALDDTEGPDSK
jgi:NAD(P)H-dependent FMN reductase